MTIASSTEEDTTEYKPTVWSLLLYRCSAGILCWLLLLPMSIGIDVFRGFEPSLTYWNSFGPRYLLSWLIGSVGATFLYRNMHTIRVTNTEISGPRGDLLYTTNTVSFERIDKKKTARPSIWQRLGRYRYIWSVDGRRV